jgi:DNA-binding Lrp family transcriptional regulator
MLIKAIPTRTRIVLESLRKMKGVQKAYITYGRFDLVCFVRLSEYGDIRKISAQINALDGVRSTETLVRA